MLTCKIGETTINLLDRIYSKDDLKLWSKKGLLKCDVCDSQYEYCHGNLVLPYFRHVKKECLIDYYESESNEHIKGKYLLYEWLKNQPNVKNLNLEYWIPETKQRPDIYFEINNKKHVIEYQCTPISSELLERKKLYKENEIQDIWIMGIDKYQSGIDNSIRRNREKVIEQLNYLYLDQYGNVYFKYKFLQFHCKDISHKKETDKVFTHKLDEFVLTDDFPVLKSALMNNYISQYRKSNLEIKKEKNEEIRLINFRHLKKVLDKNNKNYISKYNSNFYKEGVFIQIEEDLEICFFFKAKKVDICERKKGCYNNIVKISYDEGSQYLLDMQIKRTLGIEL